MVRAFSFNSRRMRAKHTIVVIFFWGFRPPTPPWVSIPNPTLLLFFSGGWAEREIPSLPVLLTGF